MTKKHKTLTKEDQEATEDPIKETQTTEEMTTTTTVENSLEEVPTDHIEAEVDTPAIDKTKNTVKDTKLNPEVEEVGEVVVGKEAATVASMRVDVATEDIELMIITETDPEETNTLTQVTNKHSSRMRN